MSERTDFAVPTLTPADFVVTMRRMGSVSVMYSAKQMAMRRRMLELNRVAIRSPRPTDGE